VKTIRSFYIRDSVVVVMVMMMMMMVMMSSCPA
jgi:hypothetical protein